MEKWKKLAAGALALALLSGCGRTAVQPTPDASVDPAPVVSAPAETVPTLSAEEEAQRAAAVKAAGEKLEGYRWPQEIEKKTIGDREVEFVLHHGNGWTIQVPVDWERVYISDWRSPSQDAVFGVSKWDLPVNNPKIYHAQMGSWRYETDYPAPFDYYYDDDGGYNPPEGHADSVYFFAPAGENSYEFTLSTVVGMTTDEERAIQEAMLLSFTQDESSRTLYGEDYQPGRSEWDFAMAGLLAEGEKLWGNWVENGWSNDVDGKTTPEYVSYVLALGEFEPGEFVQFGYDERPEGMEEEWPDALTLYLSNSKLWLYFYKDSSWASVDLAGEKWWTKVSHPVDPEKNPYDMALAWLKAEREWAGKGAVCPTYTIEQLFYQDNSTTV